MLLICTTASVSSAGMLGYAIGALLFDTLGQWLIHLYGYGDRIAGARAEAGLRQMGRADHSAKGTDCRSRIKLVTIVSGLLGYNFALFVALSIVTRGRADFSWWRERSICSAIRLRGRAGASFRRIPGCSALCRGRGWDSSLAAHAL